MFGDNLKQVIDKKGISVYRIAKDLNINKQSIVNYIENKSLPNVETANKIAEYLDTTLQFLLSGKGEPLTSKQETKSYSIVGEDDAPYGYNHELSTSYSKQSNYKLIPLYSLDVVGGINNQEVDTMGYVTGYMPFVNAQNEDIAVMVSGNSMYPTYPSGCYIQIRKVDYWQEYLEFGQVHIIELKDSRRLIKEIRKGKDEAHFKLVSHNEKFDETEVSINFIRSVWLVLAKYEKAVM